jgi:hypothetical protein
VIRARLVVLASLAIAAVAPSSAAAAGGATTLSLNGPAAEALREAGIRIAPLGAAKGGSRQVVLPVRAGLAGTHTTLLRHRGGVLFRAGKDKLRMTDLSLSLGRRSLISAKVARQKKKIDLFRVLAGGRRRVDPVAGAATLSGLGLKLTGAGANLIDRRFETAPPTAQLRRARFAKLSATATGLLAGGGAKNGGAPTATPDGAAGASGCPLPSGAGPAPEDPLPPPPAAPAGAVGVSGATLDWHVRESFVRYIATGEGTSAIEGATADPPVLLPGASAPLSYGFDFPFAGGSWHHEGADPGSMADDSAAIRFGGALRFLYSGHGIDLKTAQPEIEIAGTQSRAIFNVSEKGNPGQRQVLVNLDLARAAAIGRNGNAVTYERVPAAIPSGTATSVFGGFYSPGTDFGCFTLSYSTQ